MGGFIKLDKTVNDIGMLIPLDEYENKKKLNSYLKKSPKSDWYASLFTFGKEAEEYFKKAGKIAGYKGEAYVNKLVFDFDSKNIEEAREDAKHLLVKLKELGVSLKDSVKVYFSGNKGFHLIVATKESYKPEELKLICTSLSGENKTFDAKIYDRTRKFRIENTVHQVSQLYKIELTGNEFNNLTVDEIKQKAKNPCILNKELVPTEVSFIKLAEVKKVDRAVIVGEIEEIDGIRGLNDIDFSKCPKERPKCIHALLYGVMVPDRSERYHIMLHLGNYLRNQGFDKEAVHGQLKGIVRKNAALYPDSEPWTKERVYNQVITQVFNGNHNTGGWGVDKDDTTFSSYCSSINSGKPCPLHDVVEKKESLVKIDEVFKSFTNFAENFEANIVPTGIGFIDKYMKLCAGTTNLLVGAPGSGKTSLCLNIMENANRENIHTVFFSLDMHKNLIYLKLAQKLTDFDQDEILNIFKNRELAKIEIIKKAIADNYGTTHFDFSGTLSMDDMKERILQLQIKEGIDIKLVVIDYASRISGPYSDSYANAKYNALRSKDVASDTDAAWIILSQVSRNTGDGSSPLRTKRAAKDAGDWEESAQNLITMWRPFMGMDGQVTEEGVELKDDIIRLYLAKNRMGRELEAALNWDGSRGSITDMAEDEAAQYKDQREPHEKEIQKVKRGF